MCDAALASMGLSETWISPRARGLFASPLAPIPEP